MPERPKSGPLPAAPPPALSGVLLVFRFHEYRPVSPLLPGDKHCPRGQMEPRDFFQGSLVPEKDSGKLRHGEDADPEKTQETTRPREALVPPEGPRVLLPSSQRLFSPARELAEQGPGTKCLPPPSLAGSPGLPGRSVQLFRKENIFFSLYLDSCRDSDGEKRMSDY